MEQKLREVIIESNQRVRIGGFLEMGDWRDWKQETRRLPGVRIGGYRVCL